MSNLDGGETVVVGQLRIDQRQFCSVFFLVFQSWEIILAVSRDGPLWLGFLSPFLHGVISELRAYFSAGIS